MPPLPEPEYYLVDLQHEIAATRPRAVLWVGLDCDEWEMIYIRPDGRFSEIVDPIAQWRYVYRDTPFESLN